MQKQSELFELAHREAKTLCVYTTGQVQIFNSQGISITDLEEYLNESKDPALFRFIAESCDNFAISKWPDWYKVLSKEEFFNICKI